MLSQSLCEAQYTVFWKKIPKNHGGFVFSLFFILWGSWQNWNNISFSSSFICWVSGVSNVLEPGVASNIQEWTGISAQWGNGWRLQPSPRGGITLVKVGSQLCCTCQLNPNSFCWLLYLSNMNIFLWLITRDSGLCSLVLYFLCYVLGTCKLVAFVSY